MPEAHDLFTSFNAGELSPRISSRVDFQKFKSGLSELVNMVPLPEGGISRRAGTRYVGSTKTSTVKSRLKEFEFSTTQAYILDFGDQNIQFYRNQARINAGNITASITNGTFNSDISSWTDKSVGGGSIAWNSTEQSMNLVYSTTEGHAEQQVTNALAVEHTLRFRVKGAAGNSVLLRVGTSTGGNEIVDDFIAFTGWHTYSFTATAADFFVQFIGNSEKTMEIDDVSLIDNAAIELTTPYAEADLGLIEGPQSADVLYLFHKDYPTYKLERRGHTTWSLVQVAWWDGPYEGVNSTSTTMTPSATTGKGITVTASSITGVNGGLGFQTTDVGRLIRIDNPASGVDWGFGVIVGRSSTTVVTVDVDRDFATTNADTNWALGSWSDTTGHPSVGAFFEQRLFVANNGNSPQTFWASQTADFENFGPDSDPVTDGIFDGSVEDDDSFDFTISADDVNAIFWMSAGEDTLAIGTAGGEWVPSSTGSVLTPSDISVKRQVTTKAAQIQPVRVDNVVLFVQRAKRKIMEFGFAFETDGFQSVDMTRLAQHITIPAVDVIKYAEEPESQVWALLSNGNLASMTFRRQEDVVGWARQTIGGQFAGGKTLTASDISFTAAGDTIGSVAKEFDGYEAGDILFIDGSVSNDYGDIGLVTISEVSDDKGTITISENVLVDETAGASITITAMSNPVVESIAVIPGNDGAGQVQDSTARDEVWMIVKRTIGGATVRYIEVIEKAFENPGIGEEGDDQEDAYYADSMITYDSTSTSTITGLTHLEGETVKILADGGTHADKTVASGQITLDEAASVVQVGLGYSHRIKTLRLEGGNPAGTAVGKTKRIDGVTFVLLNSQTLRWGPVDTNMFETDFREVTDPMDYATPYFTGDYYTEFDGEWDSDPRIIIEHDDPTPFTLLTMAPELRINAIK